MTVPPTSTLPGIVAPRRQDVRRPGTETSTPSIPFDLGRATTQQLRRWSNLLYKQLDAEFPPYGALEDHARVAAETDYREEGPRTEKVPAKTTAGQRLKVRDNDVKQRFELFTDGTLAACIDYTMHAREVRLRRTLTAGIFEGSGLEKELISRVLLLTHKRRLAIIADCPFVQHFLTGNPQYRQFLHSP
ncbi:GNAT family N-acetyltransferase [Arthrobacter sp. L77]|uniref:GNAT family N-acetyltransferase n=1 Tax=Arthrobacter sp. L77 TaxID=1496689 RepID=UPI0005B89F24|nr:N-acetyltransferase [Arthrobacter sp. L77]